MCSSEALEPQRTCCPRVTRWRVPWTGIPSDDADCTGRACFRVFGDSGTLDPARSVGAALVGPGGAYPGWGSSTTIRIQPSELGLRSPSVLRHSIRPAADVRRLWGLPSLLWGWLQLWGTLGGLPWTCCTCRVRWCLSWTGVPSDEVDYTERAWFGVSGSSVAPELARSGRAALGGAALVMATISG